MELVHQPHHPPGRQREHQPEPQAVRHPRRQPERIAQREERAHREQVAGVLPALDLAEVAGAGPQRRDVGKEAGGIDVQVDLRVGAGLAGPLEERDRERRRAEPERNAFGGGHAGRRLPSARVTLTNAVRAAVVVAAIGAGYLLLEARASDDACLEAGDRVFATSGGFEPLSGLDPAIDDLRRECDGATDLLAAAETIRQASVRRPALAPLAVELAREGTRIEPDNYIGWVTLAAALARTDRRRRARAVRPRAGAQPAASDAGVAARSDTSAALSSRPTSATAGISQIQSTDALTAHAKSAATRPAVPRSAPAGPRPRAGERAARQECQSTRGRAGPAPPRSRAAASARRARPRRSVAPASRGRGSPRADPLERTVGDRLERDPPVRVAIAAHRAEATRVRAAIRRVTRLELERRADHRDRHGEGGQRRDGGPRAPGDGSRRARACDARRAGWRHPRARTRDTVSRSISSPSRSGSPPLARLSTVG